MYKIEKKSYGFKLIFADVISDDDMLKWVGESKRVLLNSPKDFGVFVDMRTLKPLTTGAQGHMQEGQKLYKEKGMTRSAVVVASAMLKMQFKRIARETGIYQWERYIDASSEPNWEKVGEEWITKGVDPD